MGRTSTYSKEGILESLLEAHNSGVPLRIKELKEAGKGGVLSAINRHKRRHRHLKFFENLHDAREKLASYVANQLNDSEKAEQIREFNEPRERIKYNKRAIKQGLLEHFDAGGELDGESIQKTWLHNAIYYHEGKIKTYGSLIDAREALALMLERKKRFEDAAKVRQYNVMPDRKMPEPERELRRKELIEKLRQKVESGENLGHRAQQKIDRSFVSSCNHYFGSYSKIFDVAGLNYNKFANRPLNKSPEEYFAKFLELIESSGTLQRQELEKINHKLMDRINEYESGYFQALEKARLYYSGKMLFEKVKYIDDFLTSDEKSPRDVMSKENAAKRQELIESMLFFDSKTPYSIDDKKYIPENSVLAITFSGISGKMTGKEIMDLAEISGEWLESVPFSEKVHMERSNIKNLFHKYHERILKIGFGKQQKYLFHQSIIVDELNEGKIFDRVLSEELTKISESSAQRKYFRNIIMPKLNVRLKDKAKYTPEEIKWWVYEFGGTRVIETYIEKNVKEWPLEDREIALKEMRKLCSDYSQHKEDNIYGRLQKILSNHT